MRPPVWVRALRSGAAPPASRRDAALEAAQGAGSRPRWRPGPPRQARREPRPGRRRGRRAARSGAAAGGPAAPGPPGLSRERGPQRPLRRAAVLPRAAAAGLVTGGGRRVPGARPSGGSACPWGCRHPKRPFWQRGKEPPPRPAAFSHCRRRRAAVWRAAAVVGDPAVRFHVARSRPGDEEATRPACGPCQHPGARAAFPAFNQACLFRGCLLTGFFQSR